MSSLIKDKKTMSLPGCWNMRILLFKVSVGVPAHPKCWSSHTQPTAYPPKALWLPMITSMVLGFAFAKSTSSSLICLFNCPASFIIKENLSLTGELWQSQHTGQRKKTKIIFGKCFSLNLTQLEMPHIGPSLGKVCNFALINKVVKSKWLNRDKWVTLPCFSTHRQPFPESTRLTVSPTSGCSESLESLLKSR